MGGIKQYTTNRTLKIEGSKQHKHSNYKLNLEGTKQHTKTSTVILEGPNKELNTTTSLRT